MRSEEGKRKRREQEPEPFGTVLRRIRQVKRLTQRQVARAITMDFSYFSRLEMDRFQSLPTCDTVIKIAEACAVRTPKRWSCSRRLTALLSKCRNVQPCAACI